MDLGVRTFFPESIEITFRPPRRTRPVHWSVKSLNNIHNDNHGESIWRALRLGVLPGRPVFNVSVTDTEP